MNHGIVPGPKMGRLLTSVQNLQMEGKITTHEEALEWALAHADDAEGSEGSPQS